MKNGAIATLVVIAIFAGAAMGYLIGANSLVGSKNQTQATTSCTVSGPTIGVVIKVVEGGLFGAPSPVAGAKVEGEADGYCNDLLQTQTLPPTVTNSSGWASLLDGGFGVYNINISYEVSNPPVTENFHLSISMQPITVAYILFNTTTGNVTTHFCEYDLNCHFGA